MLFGSVHAILAHTYTCDCPPQPQTQEMIRTDEISQVHFHFCSPSVAWTSSSIYISGMLGYFCSPGLFDRHWYVPCWCTLLGTNPIKCQMQAISPTAVTLPGGCDLKETTRRNLQEIMLPLGADSCTIGKIRLLLSNILFAISAVVV